MAAGAGSHDNAATINGHNGNGIPQPAVKRAANRQTNIGSLPTLSTNYGAQQQQQAASQIQQPAIQPPTTSRSNMAPRDILNEINEERKPDKQSWNQKISDGKIC